MKINLQCQYCGRSNSRTIYYNEFDTILCDSCIHTFRDHPVKYIPPDGEIHYCEEGKIICHVCGRSFDKLTNHIKYKHHLTKEQYKEKFGLNRTFNPIFIFYNIQNITSLNTSIN